MKDYCLSGQIMVVVLAKSALALVEIDVRDKSWVYVYEPEKI